MSRIRTLDDLQGVLDKEMSWRLKEIAELRFVSKSRHTKKRKLFIRAGVALLYAHWEGFIKSASKHYLDFVQNQRHTYRELKTSFAVLGLKSNLNLLTDSRKPSATIPAFDFILSEIDRPVRRQLSKSIDTQSNLTSTVFENIATALAIDIKHYKTKARLIDYELVKRRNRIAHGEYLDIKPEAFDQLVQDILQLMRDYKTDLQNAASTKSYKRSA